MTNLDARTMQNSLRSLIGKPVPADDRTFDQKMADALVQLCTTHLSGQVKGGRSNLPTIRLVLWCIFHHHFRHRLDIELIGDGNNLSIKYPDGRIVPLPPRGPTHASKNPHAHDHASMQANLFETDTDAA